VSDGKLPVGIPEKRGGPRGPTLGKETIEERSIEIQRRSLLELRQKRMIHLEGGSFFKRRLSLKKEGSWPEKRQAAWRYFSKASNRRGRGKTCD